MSLLRRAMKVTVVQSELLRRKNAEVQSLQTAVLVLNQQYLDLMIRFRESLDEPEDIRDYLDAMILEVRDHVARIEEFVA